MGPQKESIDGKQRRKFEMGLKQQIFQEVECGLLSVSAASRKYQISGSVIDRWRRQAKQGGLEAAHSVREKLLERENRELKERLAELYLELASTSYYHRPKTDVRGKLAVTPSCAIISNGYRENLLATVIGIF